MILVSNNIQPQWLSPMLLSQIPIKHLLEQARSRRQEFKGLYAPLLQLINTHLPHLCLVDDWLKQEEVFTALGLSASSPLPSVQCSPSHLQQGIQNIWGKCPKNNHIFNAFRRATFNYSRACYRINCFVE